MSYANALELVLELSFSSAKRGHIYLADAVELVIQNPSYLQGANKLLYPIIAEKYHISPESVSRGICRSVEDIWENGNHARLNMLANHKISKKPSPRDFIRLLSHYLESTPGGKKYKPAI